MTTTDYAKPIRWDTVETKGKPGVNYLTSIPVFAEVPVGEREEAEEPEADTVCRFPLLDRPTIADVATPSGAGNVGLATSTGVYNLHTTGSPLRWAGASLAEAVRWAALP